MHQLGLGPRPSEDLGSVIVVDEDVVVRELFSIWLDDAGYEVRVVESVAEAQTVLQEAGADVLVSDVRMTTAGGHDLVSLARERAPGLPVVLVAGRPAVDSAIGALRLGVYDYLVKPVVREDLLRVVGRAVAHWRLVEEKRRLEEENERYRLRLEELVRERTAALERRNRQLLLLNEVATTINALDDLPAVYGRVVTGLSDTFGYADVSVFSYDPEAEELRLEAMVSRREGAEAPEGGYVQPADAGLLGEAVRSRAPVQRRDVPRWPQFLVGPGREGVSAAAVFPVLVDGRLVALLAVSEDRDELLDLDTTVLETLAEHLGVAIANARLYTWLHDALVAREQMLANVSHELRSPLAVITAWSEMLADGTLGPPDEPTRKAASNILVSAHHLSHLVRQLLMFQQLESDVMASEQVDVRELLVEAVEGWRPILERAGLALELVVDDGLGMVRGSREFLRQVLHNVLDNARKFSPDGGTVRVGAQRVADEVVVTVRDEGVGIAPAQLERLFDRFYQVDGGSTRRFEGMGLGLSLSQEIVVRHGGRIWAQSEGAGRGTTIGFSLPAEGGTLPA